MKPRQRRQLTTDHSNLLLVDFTGRLFREGKAVVSADLTGLPRTTRLKHRRGKPRLGKLKGGRLAGRFFTASRERLREVAARLKVHHLANLSGCPA